MSSAERFTIPTRGGRKVHGEVRMPQGDGRAPVVVVAHGWLGHKGHGLVPYVADGLAERGLAAVTFSFSGSGVPEGADEVIDVDAFAENTVGKEIEDLEAVVTAVFERTLPGRERFEIYRIGALGHDLGASVALLEARGDTRVKAVAGLGPLVALDRPVPDEARDAWLLRETYEFRDPATNRALRLGPSYLRDLRARRKEYDLVEAVQELDRPFLVVHGDRDEAARDSRMLFFANSACAEIHVIPGADHAFGCGHPLASPTEAVGAARAAAIRFFEEKLR